MHKLVAFCLFSVSAAAYSASTAEAEPGAAYDLSAAKRSVVERAVMAVMKDPESARFGRITAAKGKDGIVTVCGYVNGRNSFGGYVGEMPFIGVLTGQNSSFYVVDIAGDEVDARATITICHRYGVGI